jgi:hypothetical protein
VHWLVIIISDCNFFTVIVSFVLITVNISVFAVTSDPVSNV